MKKGRCLIFLVMLALSGHVFGDNVYYIDGSTGNNKSNGLSLSSAWKTIAKANSALKPGDTVFIRAGTYHETIAPQLSGTDTDPITFQKYGSDNVVISRVNNGVHLVNKKHIVIEGLTIADVKRFVVISSGSRHNIIRNCRLERASGWGGLRIENSSHNKILDNFIYNGHGDLVELYPNADHNLIKGNEIFGGPLNTHSCLLVRSTENQDDSSYNIIKDNWIHGAGDDNVNILQKVEHNLIERNIIESVSAGAGLKFCGGQGNIFRKNIIVNCKAYGFGIYTNLWDSYQSHGIDNVFYHNVAYLSDRGKDMDGGFRFIVYQDGGEIGNSVVKNNVFLNNAPQQIYIAAVAGLEDRLKNNAFSNNIIFSEKAAHKTVRYMGIRYSLREIESLQGSGFSANLDSDPRFVNPGGKDFHLQSGSPAIDRGAFLTRAVTSGSGTRIKVEDARYFSDGFGVIAADTIQLEGQTKTAVIIGVDYKNNVITVDSRLKWHSGQGVSLAYSGSAPDIGVFEFVKPTASAGSEQIPPLPLFFGHFFFQKFQGKLWQGQLSFDPRGFPKEPIKPFQPGSLNPFWGPGDFASHDIQRSADSHADFGLEPLLVFLNPFFLFRASQSDK